MLSSISEIFKKYFQILAYFVSETCMFCKLKNYNALIAVNQVRTTTENGGI